MKKGFIALAVVALVAAPALAQSIGNSSDVVEKNVRTPATTEKKNFTPDVPASVPAPVAKEVVNEPKCVDAKIVRSNVGEHKTFTVTFGGTTVEAMRDCNPQAQVDQTRNGTRIIVSYGNDGASIKVPSTLKDGNVHQARCVNNTTGSVSDTQLYRAAWHDAVPSVIDLKLVDKAFYDSAKARATCQRIADSGKYH